MKENIHETCVAINDTRIICHQFSVAQMLDCGQKILTAPRCQLEHALKKRNPYQFKVIRVEEYEKILRSKGITKERALDCQYTNEQETIQSIVNSIAKHYRTPQQVVDRMARKVEYHRGRIEVFKDAVEEARDSLENELLCKKSAKEELCNYIKKHKNEIVKDW